MTKSEWKKIWIRKINKGTCICYLCGKLIENVGDLSKDHVVPISRNGADSPKNWKPTHKICNNNKGSLTFEEWLLYKALVEKKNGKIK